MQFRAPQPKAGMSSKVIKLVIIAVVVLLLLSPLGIKLVKEHNDETREKCRKENYVSFSPVTTEYLWGFWAYCKY